MLSQSQGVSGPVVNGVQPAAHQNGVSANGEAADFEEIIQLNNSGNPAQTQSGLVSDPILAFEGGEPFLMKTGPMKPQHVAGTVMRRQTRLGRVLCVVQFTKKSWIMYTYDFIIHHLANKIPVPHATSSVAKGPILGDNFPVTPNHSLWPQFGHDL